MATTTPTTPTTTAPTTVQYDPVTSNLLTVGSRGADVKTIQTYLINNGYNVGSYGADGIFGSNTLSAIKAYQAANNLVVDGIVGPKTLTAMGLMPQTATTTTPSTTPSTTPTTTPTTPTTTPSTTPTAPTTTPATTPAPTTPEQPAATTTPTTPEQPAGGEQAPAPTTPGATTTTPESTTAPTTTTTTTTTYTPISSTIIKIGSKGDDVKTLQQWLIDHGYDLGKWGADGIYGDATAAAVRAYQKDNNLTVDGIVGNQTLTAMGLLAGSSGTGSGTGTTTEQPTSDTYLEQANNMKFEYNAAADPEYKQAAAELEQQVTNMMIGRGGLFSSVWSGSLQTRMIKLQVAYTKMAYEKFVTDRNFAIQMAQLMMQKENTEWEQDMAERQFAADQAQRAFENYMAKLEYNLSAAKSAYGSSYDGAQQQVFSSNAQLNTMINDYLEEESWYGIYRSEWSKSGTADSVGVQDFFNVPAGAPIDMYWRRLDQVEYRLNKKLQDIQTLAAQVKDQQVYLAAANNFQNDNSNEEVSTKYTNAQQSQFFSAMSAANNSNASNPTANSWTKLLNNATDNYQTLSANMGGYLYGKFIDYLEDKVKTEPTPQENSWTNAYNTARTQLVQMNSSDPVKYNWDKLYTRAIQNQKQLRSDMGNDLYEDLLDYLYQRKTRETSTSDVGVTTRQRAEGT